MTLRKRSLLRICATLSMAISVIIPASPSSAASEEIPDRCAYAYAAASYRMAAMVGGQVNQLGSPDALTLAQRAVQLTRDLNCPNSPMLKSVDCAVEIVRKSGGRLATVEQVISCVGSNIDRPFPKLGN